MKSFFIILVLMGLSAVAAIGGLGMSYQDITTPRSAAGRFENIHADGWMEKDAAISFPQLASRGNRVELTLDGQWRPAGSGVAHLRISLCGRPLTEIAVSGDSPVVVPLKGSCEPRRIDIEGLNAFEPANAKDDRLLSLQLRKAVVRSRIGVPIVDLAAIVKSSAAIFALSLCVMLLLPKGGVRAISWAIPVAALFVLGGCDKIGLINAGYLCICLTALAAGMALGKGGWQSVTIDSRGVFFTMAAITLLAAALRFYGLSFGLPSNFHPDEVPKVNAIMRMYQQGNLDPHYFLHPSLLLYSTYGMNSLFHSWLGFEGPFRDSAFLAGRTVSAIAGTLSVPLLFWIARRLYGVRAAAIAALLFAAFPLHIACSRYLKEDALLLFNVLLSTTVMIEAVFRRRPALLLLSSLLAGVAASSKYSGLLAGAIVCASPWLVSGKWMPDWKFLFWAVASLALMPVAFAMCTPYSILNSDFLHSLGYGTGIPRNAAPWAGEGANRFFNYEFLRDFRSEQNHMSKGHTIAVDAWSQLWMFHYARSIIPGMTWLPAILGTVAAGYLIARRRMEDLFIVGLILIFYLPAEWVKAKPAPQPERYILPCLPFMAVAIGAMLNSIRGRAIPLGIAAFAILFPIVRSAELASEIPHDTRDRLATWVLEHVPQGSKMLIDYKRYSPEFPAAQYQVEYMLQARIISRLDIKSLKSSGTDYLILSSLFYERYFSQPQESAAVRQRIREVFSRVPILKQIKPTFGTYGFHNPTVTIFSLKAEDFARLEEELRQKAAGQIAKTSNEEKGDLGIESWY